jgi:hypothetical protein
MARSVFTIRDQEGQVTFSPIHIQYRSSNVPTTKQGLFVLGFKTHSSSTTFGHQVYRGPLPGRPSTTTTTTTPGNKRSAKRRKLNHKAYKNWSQPVLTFEHANRDLLYLDIDVHPRLGLLAAGQDTSTDIGIRISNIWTGKIVREISRRTDDMEYRGPQQHWTANRTLKFIERDDGDGGVDLWTCWDGGIAKFS